MADVVEVTRAKGRKGNSAVCEGRETDCRAVLATLVRQRTL